VAIYDASAALGGALTSAVALADVLRDRGARVQLVCARAPEREVADAFDDAVTLTTRRFRDTHGRPFYARELNRARALRALWKTSRPDVVLLNNAPAPNAAGWLAARALGLPVVQYVRGAVPTTGLGRLLLNDVDAVYTVGEVATSAARRLGAQPTIVDEGLSDSRWPAARAVDATDWLFAASGHAWKGAAEIIDAYGAVRRERPLPRLWVCLTRGDVADPVALPDPLPPGVVVRWNELDLDGVRRRCRAFLHHSQRPEPFGRALLEAMAAGLCPVAPSEGGPAAFVEHGWSGFLFAPRDPGAARDAIRWLAEADDVAARGARAAKVAARFRAEIAFAPVVTSLEDVVARRRYAASRGSS
jgi:glycosyltransferase involved in cell wall biosynthesis